MAVYKFKFSDVFRGAGIEITALINAKNLKNAKRIALQHIIKINEKGLKEDYEVKTYDELWRQFVGGEDLYSLKRVKGIKFKGKYKILSREDIGF